MCRDCSHDRLLGSLWSEGRRTKFGVILLIIERYLYLWRCMGRVRHTWYDGRRAPQRSSTIVVHPEFFFDVPHLRSSIPHPKTDSSKQSNCIPMNNPMAQVYKNVIYFSKQYWHCDAFGLIIVWSPIIQKKNSRNVLPLSIVERSLRRWEPEKEQIGYIYYSIGAVPLTTGDYSNRYIHIFCGHCCYCYCVCHVCGNVQHERRSLKIMSTKKAEKPRRHY